MYQYKATIVRVIDGDTVVADVDLGFNTWRRGEHLRVYGINTPEVRHKDLEHKARGIAAKKRVEELLPVGRVVTINTAKDRSGKYGRMLADFFLEEHFETLSAVLIREGHAERVDYT